MFLSNFAVIMRFHHLIYEQQQHKGLYRMNNALTVCEKMMFGLFLLLLFLLLSTKILTQNLICSNQIQAYNYLRKLTEKYLESQHSE